MNRSRTYYYDFVGGELENVPEQYRMTREEMAEFRLAMDFETVNLELAEAAILDKQDQEIS